MLGSSMHLHRMPCSGKTPVVQDFLEWIMQPTENQEKILGLLAGLYGEATGRQTCERLIDRLERRIEQPVTGEAYKSPPNLSQRDAILIAYGDQVRDPGFPALHTLADFCSSHLAGLVSGIHILPFYPYSSDDGFSVIDYGAVDPELGSWKDVAWLGSHFRLMFDAVINHVSVQSDWFCGFLEGDPSYRDYFIVVDGDPDLRRVVRPRALPLLTSFQTATAVERVWTTFGPDQADLNYSNPQVLIEIIDILMFYVSQGAEFIRLDAIAYLWKEIGTSCIHLPQTHQVIQLFRAILDECAPQVLLVTETNVPHEDNVAYFGNGAHEAQMVYNFALPPLVLHSILTGDAGILTRWAQGLGLPSKQVTFFNFLASHDGIGLNPIRGILPEGAIDRLVECTLENGGLVSYKSNPDGTQSPYELNISYFDALSDPAAELPVEEQVDRFMAAHGIMLSLIGVPGIYFHSLFGSRGWPQGVEITGRNRSINRQKMDRGDLERELAAPGQTRELVFSHFKELLRARAASPAFHPFGEQRVIASDIIAGDPIASESIFAVLRTSQDGEDRVLCLQNVSCQPQMAAIDPEELEILGSPGISFTDRISGKPVFVDRKGLIPLRPYQTLWLGLPH